MKKLLPILKYLSLIFLLALTTINGCKEEENSFILTKIRLTAPVTEVVFGLSGSTLQITAEGLDQNNNPIDIPNIAWSTSSSQIASIDQNGLLNIISVGVVQITATSGSILGSTKITINQPPMLTTIILETPINNAISGVTGPIQIVSTAIDQNNNIIEDVMYSWSSSDEQVGTVDQEGEVTFLGEGDLIIKASANGISATTSTIKVSKSFTYGTTIFQNVTVLDVETGNFIAGQDVIIEGNYIINIVDTGGSLPTGNVINGTGKFLTPGLSDGHVHVIFESDFIKYLANSITSVLDMGNSSKNPPPALEWKKRVISGDLNAPNYYPSILMRGPQFTNARFTISNAADAREAVKDNKDYDLIKAYSFIPSDGFSALITEGKKYGLAVMGHGNRNLGLKSILAQGQVMIAHAEEYLYVHYNGIDPSQTQEAIDLTLDAQAYIVATMSTYEAISLVSGQNQSGYNELINRPGYEYLDQAYRNVWENQYLNTYSQTGNLTPNLEFQKQYVKQFHDAGIPLMLGTDSPGIVGQHAGFSIHEEMRTLQEAGISDADILKIATSNFGDFIKKHTRNKEDFGKIKNGFRADLVLLDSNPIGNLKVYRDPAIVMVRGKVYTREFMLAELEKLRN